MKLRSRVLVFVCALALGIGQLTVVPAYAETACTITATVVNKMTGAIAKDVIWIVYEWDPVASHWDYCASGHPDAYGKITAQVNHPSTAGKAILVIHGIDSYVNYAYKDISPADLYDDWIAPFPDVDDTKSYAAATRIPVATGATVSLGTLKLTPKAAPAPGEYGAIRGRVTEGYSGKALYASVSAYRKEGSGGWYLKKTVQTADDGTYVLEGTQSAPLTGEIRVVMTPQVTGGYPVAWADADSVWSARSLFIGSNTTVYGVDQSIALGGRLSGTVIAAEKKTPVVAASVSAYRWISSTAGWESIHGDDTDASGRYVLPPFWSANSGTYRIGAFDFSGTYAETFYGQSTSVAKATDISLATGQVISGLDIWMSRAPVVAGRVTNTFGAPLSDILAEVFQLQSDGSWRSVGRDLSDQYGRYRVVCSAAGTYTVRLVDQGGTAVTDDDSVAYPGAASDLEHSTRVTLGARGAAVAPVTVITPVDSARASRVWGMDRYATAIAVSREAFPAGETKTVVLATGENFPDALSASGLAGAVDGPVLLTRKSTLYRGLLTEFDRLGVQKIYLLGSSAAISSAQEGLLRALGYEVERISGADRYATCAAVAREIDQLIGLDAGSPVFVTRGDAYPDALSVAPAAYASGGVVLLVGPTSTPGAVATAASTLGLKDGYAVGGSNVLPASSLAGLTASGMQVQRIAGGQTRYETAVQFADYAERVGWVTCGQVGVATGAGFADALGAGAALGHDNGLLLLTDPSGLTSATGSAISVRSESINSLNLYGSVAAVKSPVLLQIGSR